MFIVYVLKNNYLNFFYLFAQRNSQKSDTSEYESLQIEAQSPNLYHPLTKAQDNKQNNATISENIPREQSTKQHLADDKHTAPIYFETEPIYSDATSPFNDVQEPLYHETVPDGNDESGAKIGGNNETISKDDIPVPPSSRRPSETPPPVPTSRRPSSALYNLPTPSTTQEKYNTEV